MSSIKLNHFNHFDNLPHFNNGHDFLNFLPGPSVFHFTGKYSNTCRVVVTLLHGNEPSGLKALSLLLNEKYQPYYDTKFIVASVVAAKTEPEFSHRMLTGKRDLNRCFSAPFDDLQGKLAQSIIELLTAYSPQAVVDLHNTSGSGPAFAVTTIKDNLHLAISSHFCHRQITTDISLGSLMECRLGFPIVTIEAGGAQDEEADLIAYNGLKSFLGVKEIEQIQDVELLASPRRLEIKPNINICFANVESKQTDITIMQDIEKLNFGCTKTNTPLAYCTSDALSYFNISDQSDVAEYFKVEDGILYTKIEMKMFMVTTRADIAKSDCLFYFVVD